MKCPECRSIMPNHKLDCGTGRSQAPVPRAVGGYSPEEWLQKLTEFIDEMESDTGCDLEVTLGVISLKKWNNEDHRYDRWFV